MLPIRRAQHVKKSTRPTVGHKAVKPLTHHPKCIQATVPSASLGSHPGVILHLHQSERLLPVPAPPDAKCGRLVLPPELWWKSLTQKMSGEHGDHVVMDGLYDRL